jgi:hypothetical protein
MKGYTKPTEAAVICRIQPCARFARSHEPNSARGGRARPPTKYIDLRAGTPKCPESQVVAVSASVLGEAV